MKKIVIMTAATGAALFCGCQPQLEQTPFTGKDAAWIQTIKGDYPSWTPPKLAPPHTRLPENELVGNYQRQPGVVTPLPEYGSTVVIEEPTVFVNVPQEPVPVEKPVVTPKPFTPANVDVVKPQPVVKPAGVAPAIVGGALVKDGKYTVVPGDSLWKIAAKVYGNGKYFKTIQDANPGIDSNRLKLGTQIIIPGTVAATPEATVVTPAETTAPVVIPVPTEAATDTPITL